MCCFGPAPPVGVCDLVVVLRSRDLRRCPMPAVVNAISGRKIHPHWKFLPPYMRIYFIYHRTFIPAIRVYKSASMHGTDDDLVGREFNSAFSVRDEILQGDSGSAIGVSFFPGGIAQFSCEPVQGFARSVFCSGSNRWSQTSCEDLLKRAAGPNIIRSPS